MGLLIFEISKSPSEQFVKYLSLFLFIAASFVMPLAAQMPETEEVDPEVYLAKGDGKGNPGDAATEFSPTDIPIFCVVRLGSSDPVTVKMYLVAVSVKGVKPESRIVSTSYTTSDGQNEVYFTGRPEKTWHAGSYRADIFVEGKPFRSLDFVVSSNVPAATGNSFAPKSAKAKPRRPKAKPSGN